MTRLSYAQTLVRAFAAKQRLRIAFHKRLAGLDGKPRAKYRDRNRVSHVLIPNKHTIVTRARQAVADILSAAVDAAPDFAVGSLDAKYLQRAKTSGAALLSLEWSSVPVIADASTTEVAALYKPDYFCTQFYHFKESGVIDLQDRAHYEAVVAKIFAGEKIAPLQAALVNLNDMEEGEEVSDPGDLDDGAAVGEISPGRTGAVGDDLAVDEAGDGGEDAMEEGAVAGDAEGVAVGDAAAAADDEGDPAVEDGEDREDGVPVASVDGENAQLAENDAVVLDLSQWNAEGGVRPLPGEDGLEV